MINFILILHTNISSIRNKILMYLSYIIKKQICLKCNNREKQHSITSICVTIVNISGGNIEINFVEIVKSEFKRSENCP